jgi:hypothetical protein
MTERLAKLVAEELNGTAEHTGGGLWVVLWTKPDGTVVELGSSGMMEYQSREDQLDGQNTSGVFFD